MRNPLQWMNTMVTEAYYFSHFLAFFSYVAVRVSSVSLLSPHLTRHLLYREIQAVLAFAVLTVVKFVKEETFEAFIGDTLFFAKLEDTLAQGNTPKLWLVEFRASCASDCVRTSRCFPELSITYSNKNLSFGVVDLGLFPNAAEKFGISLTGSMGQLPTYILFEHATEITRLPELNSQTSAFHHPVTKRRICQHFELDRLLLGYLSGK